MVYADTNIGSRGILRCEVTVESQNVQANTSTVRVKGQVRLSSGGPSGDQTGNCKVSITGERSWGPVPYSFVNLYTSWFTFADQVYTIPHNQDGTKSVTYSAKFGPTITQNLGSGGTSTVSGFALPRIARAPAAPSLGNPIFVDTGVARISWSAPASSLPIQEYQVSYWPTANAGNVVSKSVSGNKTFYELDISGISSSVTFRVTARNSAGYSPPSNNVTADLSSLATAPGGLAVSYPAYNTGTVTWNAPSSMGTGSFVEYVLQIATVPDFSARTEYRLTTRSRNFDVIQAGEKRYVRVRVKTTKGDGPWSAVVETITPSGPAIKYGGTWRQTILYVYTGGQWRVAVPYVKVKDNWRMASF